MAGIGCTADGILSAFSDDKEPYADGRMPDTNWIAYVGDELSSDQKITDGNELMPSTSLPAALCATGTSPSRRLQFRNVAVIVQRRLRWGVGENKQWRREFLWVLAPVPSPERETWPADVLEALDADTGALYDDTDAYRPSNLNTRSATPRRATRTPTSD